MFVRLQQAIFEHYGESGMLRYESFLKMVLPREDRRVRSMVMCRRTPSSGVQGERDLGRDAGYHFIRLLEQEAALNDEVLSLWGCRAVQSLSRRRAVTD